MSYSYSFRFINACHWEHGSIILSDMKLCTYTKDELGNDVAIYPNGFTFTGILNNSNPVKGTIKDDKGHLVYEGEIEFDIYQYFQQYQKSGRTIKTKK